MLLNVNSDTRKKRTFVVFVLDDLFKAEITSLFFGLLEALRPILQLRYINDNIGITT